MHIVLEEGRQGERASNDVGDTQYCGAIREDVIMSSVIEHQRYLDVPLQNVNEYWNYKLLWPP